MIDFINNYSNEKSLHPFTLLYRVIMQLPGFLIPMYLIFIEKESSELFYFIILLISIVLVLPSIILNFIYFRFQILPNEIVIRSGVLSKKQRNIPLNKVQNINITQNFLQRLLSLAKVQIETAGDIHSEGMLEFVSVKDADEISKTIRHFQANTMTEAAKESEVNNQQSETNVLFSMKLKDVFTFGLFRFRPLFLFFGFWLYSFLQQFSYFNNLVQEFIVTNLKNIESFDPLTFSIFVVVSTLVIILLSWMMDILWTMNTFYNFTLKFEQNKLITNFGLFSKKQVTIPFKKLQQISIITNLLKKKFGFYSLRLHTAGFGIQSKGNDIAVPNSDLNKIYDVIDKIKKYRIPDNFIQISKKSIRRVFIRYLFGIILITGTLYYFASEGLYLLLLIPLLYYFSYLNWKLRGYYIEDDTLYIKYGIFLQKINIIPVKRLQLSHINETFFQRRLGLATLHLVTASVSFGGETVIRDIERNDAYQLEQIILNKFKENNYTNV